MVGGDDDISNLPPSDRLDEILVLVRHWVGEGYDLNLIGSALQLTAADPDKYREEVPGLYKLYRLEPTEKELWHAYANVMRTGRQAERRRLGMSERPVRINATQRPDTAVERTQEFMQTCTSCASKLGEKHEGGCPKKKLWSSKVSRRDLPSELDRAHRERAQG